MDINSNFQIESLPNEEWRDVVGYEGLYQVSNMGRVKSLPRLILFCDGRRRFYNERIVKSQKVSTGYRNVSLYRNAVVEKIYVHRLVANAFLQNNNKYTDVNHLDGCKTNNKAENLEWCNRSRNIKHAYENKLRESYTYNAIQSISKTVLQFTPYGEFVAEYPSTMEASRITKYNQSQIATYCRGENKRFLTYKGYIWRYKDE